MADATMTPARVEIENAEWRLVGDLTLPDMPGPSPAVLMLNQAAGDRTAYRSLSELLAGRGIAAFALDMRGHGESTNVDTFSPGENANRDLIWESQGDVIAALDWLRRRPEIDADRIAVVGASYSGEEMAEAARIAGYETAYVALSPGSFSDASIDAIDSSGSSWLLVVSRDERYLKEITEETRSRSRAVEVWELSGVEHATDLLEAHDDLAERIAVWLDRRLSGKDDSRNGAIDSRKAWFRGNVHVHTNRSDGRSAPEDVVEWYRSRGYDFLFLTDHNVQVVDEELVSRFEVPGEFLLFPGVEVDSRVGRRPVHLNALGVETFGAPVGGESVEAVIRGNREVIENAGGLAVLNHPNGILAAAIRPDEITGTGIRHFEVCCADFMGGSGHPSTDEIWDAVLTNGDVLYGIAADDAHDFGPDSRDPGSAWVVVRAAELSREAILAALTSGDFYSTTGVVLEALRQTENGLCLRVADAESYGFRTEFIGPGGRVLHMSESADPCFERTGSGGYVRARIQRSDGARAWIQPVFAARAP